MSEGRAVGRQGQLIRTPGLRPGPTLEPPVELKVLPPAPLLGIRVTQMYSKG